MTSATSAIGIALHRPRGGVGSVLGPGDGEENILAMGTSQYPSSSQYTAAPREREGVVGRQKQHKQDSFTHIQTPSAMLSNLLRVLRLFSSSCCATAERLTVWKPPTDDPRVGRGVFDVPDRAFICA